MSSVVFGPYCTQILADFGAEVIKVEAPTGDVFRYGAKSAQSKGMAPGHIALNRGKKSVVLDLKQANDAAAMKKLIEDADIFIHNVRLDAITRLGFDYDSIRKFAPKILYVHCVGFGSEGPYEGLQAYDDVIQAASGTATLLSRVDGDPRPRYFPSLIADKVAGLHAAYAVMAGLIHRMRTGKGQFIEVPMFEAFTNFMLKEHLGGRTFEPPVGPDCYARQIDPHRQPFPTADGYISIVPYQISQFGKVVAILGDPDFEKQEQFSTPVGLLKGQGEFYRRIGELTCNYKTEELVRLMHSHSIPAMAVRDIAEMTDDPHLNAVGFFFRREDWSEGTTVEMREPSRFSEWEPERPDPAPLLGEHDNKYLAR